MITFEHCISTPLMECDSHPERVVLLGQIGEDVGVEHSRLQEAAPQSSQLGAELAHVPADLLCYLLMAFLQLMDRDGSEKNISLCYQLNTLTIKDFPKYTIYIILFLGSLVLLLTYLQSTVLSLEPDLHD